ncbi:MAG TPA: bifunctional alpha,alpha-trehalose-phosphate synthase (UDP-forming)/trehalose-phosphatase, partial [Emticicia sp.]
MDQKLIIVSNRLPFRLEKRGEKYDIKQSSGGLVTALQSLNVTDLKTTWMGIADFKKDIWEKVKTRLINAQYALHPLFIEKKKYNRYYNGLANTTIWPLFHYFPSYAEYDEECYEAYKNINLDFASQINSIAGYGDMVWIQDYHLLLLPKYLRELRQDLKIGFFLHIPFPSYEIMKFIPGSWRGEILDSLTKTNVIGFHTKEYLHHFKKSLEYFSGITALNNDIISESHKTLAKDYPISIDYQNFNNAYDIPAVRRGRNSIRQKNRNKKIIFSVDRLDYTKGVINRLQAYESLLEKNAEFHNKVVFVINVVPSRDHITKYAERKKMIEENIGRINGLYGNVHWQPIIYQYRHLTFNQLLSFYTSADIALVTPLRDGMNLVAKEFVASRKDKLGVLILSEFAGAASELNESILINPNDIETMRAGLIKGLNQTDEEQMKAMEKMQNKIRHNDIKKWTGDFLNDLNNTSMDSYHLPPHVMTFDEKVKLFDLYISSKKRLLLLDYDGTLVPYFVSPEEAKPDSDLKDLLKELNKEQENELILISGRDATTLDNWFRDTGLSLVAEHGAAFKKSGDE